MTAHTADAPVNLELAIASDRTPLRRLLPYLSAGERARFRDIKRTGRAREYAVSRWLLRALAADVLDESPARIALVTDSNRPPRVQGAGLTLSLSHSGGLCIAVAATPDIRLGCDLEHERARVRVAAIARQYFHASEAAQVEALDANAARRAFFRLWTLKEAAAKATGRGIAGGLVRPCFDNILERPRGISGGCDTPWHFWFADRMRSATTLHLAIAAGHPIGHVRARFFRAEAPSLDITDANESSRA